MGEWAPHHEGDDAAERLRRVIETAIQVEIEGEDVQARSKGMKREDDQWIDY